MREYIRDLISRISPFDEIEQRHIEETLHWVESGSLLFRIQKPDVPNKHLVSYFVVFDENSKKILLCDHKKANLWLPTGGHIELNEDPKETVRRECFEELGIQADFLYETPIFLTSTQTNGFTGVHIDVSLWYILKADSGAFLDFDKEEFHDVAWFDMDNIPYSKSDPHMGRFIKKFQDIYLKGGSSNPRNLRE